MPMSDRRYLLVAPSRGFLEVQVSRRFAHAGFISASSASRRSRLPCL
jgi:hypothetical protein